MDFNEFEHPKCSFNANGSNRSQHEKRSIIFYKTCTIYTLCNLVPVAQWLEHCVSSAKVVGSIPREHMYCQKLYNLNAL